VYRRRWLPTFILQEDLNFLLTNRIPRNFSKTWGKRLDLSLPLMAQ
jgi:hypothetical protein